jgi:hypothetical protein
VSVTKPILACLLISAVSLSAACATKRYPMATPLGSAERAAMNCRELELELIRSEEVKKQIVNTAEMDWRSVAGFLGDYGIGNAMAKNDAEKALSNRIESIRVAQIQKDCLKTGGGGGFMKFLSDLF